MDADLEFRAKAIALKLGRTPLPVVGMRPRRTAVQAGGAPTPIEQELMQAGFEPLRDFSRFQMVPHPDWTVRLPPDGAYEVDFRGVTHITGTVTTPPEWCEMVRTAGCALLVFQRGDGGEVQGASVVEALASGSTLAVAARLAA
jgi:hypothetical protein